MINEKESNINVIKYKIEDFETVDEFTEQMIKNNPIVGIIPIGKTDDEFLIPISKYEKLDDYLKSNVESVDEVLELLRQYDILVDTLENYMIPRRQIILDYDYVFIDEGTLMFMLVPTSRSHLHSHTKREFTISALLAPNYKSDEERLKVFGILSPCLPVEGGGANGDGGRNKKKFKNKRNFKNGTNNRKPQNNTSAQQESNNYKKQKKQNRLSLLKEKLFSGGEDDIFDFFQDEALPEGIHVIKVRSTGAEYPLMFGPDFIGTDPTKCSICFAGNATMSAEHCSITLSRGHYVIADLNSKSGTLLNGQPLEPGKTYELRSADLITIAGEELVFSKRG